MPCLHSSSYSKLGYAYGALGLKTDDASLFLYPREWRRNEQWIEVYLDCPDEKAAAVIAQHWGVIGSRYSSADHDDVHFGVLTQTGRKQS